MLAAQAEVTSRSLMGCTQRSMNDTPLATSVDLNSGNKVLPQWIYIKLQKGCGKMQHRSTVSGELSERQAVTELNDHEEV